MFNTHNIIGHNNAYKMSQGSGLRGYVTVSYDELCRVFGRPIEIDGEDKVQVQWIIRFEVVNEIDGSTYSVVATIYDWKVGPQYVGIQGVPYQQVTHWHIGGHRMSDSEPVRLVHEALGQTVDKALQPAHV